MKIYNKSIPLEKLKEVRKLVKYKDEFKNIDDKYIDLNVKIYFEQNFKKIDDINDKVVKELVKYIRQRNRNSYGLFQKYVAKRELLISKLKKLDLRSDESIKIHEELLRTHLSTAERLDHYAEFWDLVNNFEPNSILDVGCGLNPLSVIFSNKNYDYFSIEKNKMDASFLNKYFKIFNLNGSAYSFDVVSNYSKLNDFKVDLCLMLKVFDVFEDEIKNISYDIVKSINSKNMIASFNLNVVSGKKLMKLRTRPWFEKLLTRLGWSYTTKIIGFEVFYLCEKV